MNADFWRGLRLACLIALALLAVAAGAVAFLDPAARAPAGAPRTERNFNF